MIWYRADSRFEPSQWETSLQSNAISHWLAANLESALWYCIQYKSDKGRIQYGAVITQSIFLQNIHERHSHSSPVRGAFCGFSLWLIFCLSSCNNVCNIKRSQLSRWQWQNESQTLDSQNTTYLALKGELWGVFYEDFGENWLHYKGTALYIAPRYNSTWLYLNL